MVDATVHEYLQEMPRDAVTLRNKIAVQVCAGRYMLFRMLGGKEYKTTAQLGTWKKYL